MNVHMHAPSMAIIIDDSIESTPCSTLPLAGEAFEPPWKHFSEATT